MQSNRGIGKEWANKILANGYQSDNKEPNKTKAKIWNHKAAVFEEIELSSDNVVKSSLKWNKDFKKMTGCKNKDEGT